MEAIHGVQHFATVVMTVRESTAHRGRSVPSSPVVDILADNANFCPQEPLVDVLIALISSGDITPFTWT
ncbi:MAG: hypothetical protein ACO33B_03870 [Ilumatobacteraceae bacterium]